MIESPVSSPFIDELLGATGRPELARTGLSRTTGLGYTAVAELTRAFMHVAAQGFDMLA
jgi:hypothetical protein